MLKDQEKVWIDQDGNVFFKIDLVIINVETGKVRYVLDTKYKTPDHPDPSDISQIMSYAQTMYCQEAILLYPQPLAHQLDRQPGGIRVRSLTFELAGDLESNGQRVLSKLFVD